MLCVNKDLNKILATVKLKEMAMNYHPNPVYSITLFILFIWQFIHCPTIVIAPHHPNLPFFNQLNAVVHLGELGPTWCFWVLSKPQMNIAHIAECSQTNPFQMYLWLFGGGQS